MTEDLKIPIMKTVNEVAQITGLSKYQVRKLIFNNKVKFVKSGVKVLINLYSLIDYLNTGDSSIDEGGNENDKIRKII